MHDANLQKYFFAFEMISSLTFVEIGNFHRRILEIFDKMWFGSFSKPSISRGALSPRFDGQSIEFRQMSKETSLRREKIRFFFVNASHHASNRHLREVIVTKSYYDTTKLLFDEWSKIDPSTKSPNLFTYRYRWCKHAPAQLSLSE